MLQSAVTGTVKVYDQKTGYLIYSGNSNDYRFVLNCSAFGNDNIPTISDLELTPSTGSEKTLFTFKINYTDLDNDAPIYANLVLDDIVFPLLKENASDNNYTDGCMYYIQIYLGNGTHDYYFEASDGLFYQATTNIITMNVSRQNINVPVLSNSSVDPISGYNYTMFRFITNYTDADNNPPESIFVNFNGTNMLMSKLDEHDTNFMDGVIYYLDVSIPVEGIYQYYIEATDGTFTVRDPSEPDTYPGPNVTARKQLENYTLDLGYSYVWEDTSSGTTTSIVSPWTIDVVTLPEPFQFYDKNFTQFVISGNCFIRMGSDNINWYNDGIPSTGKNSQYILGFAPKNTPDYQFGGYVRYRVIANPDRIVIEWGNIYNDSDATFMMAFQVVLYSSGVIRFNIQNYTGDIGWVYVHYGDGNTWTSLVVNENYNLTSAVFIYPNLDVYAPGITIESPLNGSIHYSPDITVTLSTNSPDLANAWYNVYNVSSGSFVFGSNQSYNFSGVNTISINATGIYRLFAWANDTTGNENKFSSNFTVDLTQPMAFIDSPYNQTYTSISLPLALSGNPATTSIVYNVYNHTSGTFLYGTNVTYTGQTALSLAEGYYSIYAWGRNASGSPQAAPTILMVTIDLSSPSVDITSPVNGTIYSSSTINITLVSTDPVGVINRTWFNIYDEIDGSWVYSTNHSYTSSILIPLTESIYTLHAWTEDKAGNVGMNTSNFTVNLDPPVINHPADINAIENQSNVYITWIITDIYPGDYRVLRNGTQIVGWQLYASGVPINVSVDTNIGAGDFNYTIEYRDGSNIYGEPDTVIVSIGMKPVATSEPDLSAYVLANSSYYINWTLFTPNNASKYRVLRDGTEIVGWTDWPGVGVPIPVAVNTNIGLGDFNYTIEYNDSSAVFGDPNSVLIHVNDIPSVQVVADIVVAQNSSGNTIGWVINDVFNGSVRYRIYLNGTSYIGWTWTTNGTNLNVPIDTNSGLGHWNYTVEYEDAFGIAGTPDSVIVVVNDRPVSTSPTDSMVLENSSVTISWTITDTFGGSGTYDVLINNMNYLTNISWVSGMPLDIPIDTNRGIATWNYTIKYKDYYNLSGVQDVVLITINDHPTVDSPADFVVEQNSTGNVIEWTITDVYTGAGFYEILLNGSTYISWTPFTSGVSFNITVDSNAGIGDWNYTIRYRDIYNANGTKDTVIVTINDKPIAQNFTAERYGFGDVINMQWRIDDAIGSGTGHYRILLNGTLHVEGTWTNGVLFDVPVDTTALGYWNYTIQFNDSYGSWGEEVSAFVYIISIPISTHPANFSVLVNSSVNITWIITDIVGSGNYTVWLNGSTNIQSGTWTNGTAINVPINTLIGLGSWNYTIEFNNSNGEAGNPDTVIVFVDDQPIAVLQTPSPAPVYETTAGPTLSWLLLDQFGGNTYSILRNGSVINTGSWVNGSIINITVDTALPPAWYNYTLVYTDSHGFDGIQNSVMFHLLDDANIPSISNVSDNALLFSNDVSVLCTVEDNESGVAVVELHYAVNTTSQGFTTIQMNNTGGNNYSATIPSQNINSIVYYYITAEDNASNINVNNNSGNYFNYTLNYLGVGTFTFEYQIPARVVVEIQVNSPGYISMENISASIPVDALNLTLTLAKFDFEFSGDFNVISFTVYYIGEYQAAQIGVYHYDGSSWQEISATVDTNAKTITFQLSSLSPFVIGIKPEVSEGPTEEGFSFTKFLQENPYVIIIMIAAVGLAIVIGAVAARKKKIAKAEAQKAAAKKKLGKGAGQEGWVEPAVTRPLSKEEIRERLKHLFVFHRKSGVCLFYQPFVEKTIDPQLIAGFLSAISSFGDTFEQEAELKVLEYKKFKILMEETVPCRYALLFEGEMNDALNELLKAFIGEFESKYRSHLEKFSGNISVFNLATEIIQNIFNIKPKPKKEVGAAGATAVAVGPKTAKAEEKLKEIKKVYLYCPQCKDWIQKPTTEITGDEKCPKCSGPVFFVPKCTKCGHTTMHPVKDYKTILSKPPTCPKCGGTMFIQ
ncbi:MAG: hypothetical protein ACXQS8_03300 [Candidatus Helarchaeales archaeon]